MKRSFLLTFTLLLGVSTITTQAQSTSIEESAKEKYANEFRHNEVKVNLAGVFIPALDVEYDYLIREDMSVGVDLFASFNKDFPTSFQIVPNYRWFFGGNTSSMQKYASGFFIEANTALVRTREKEDYSSIGDNTQVKEVTTNSMGFGFGVAAGYKYLSTGNWIGEVFFGAGRVITGDVAIAYGRGGIMIGYRF